MRDAPINSLVDGLEEATRTRRGVLIDLAAFIVCTATCSVHPRAARTWQKSRGVLGESCASHGSPRAGAIGAAFVPAHRDTMDRMTRKPGKNKRSRRVDTIDAALSAWHAVPCSVESERKRDHRVSSLVSLEPRGEVICPVPSRRVGCDPIPYLFCAIVTLALVLALALCVNTLL